MRIVDLSVPTGPGPGEPLPGATGFTVSCLPVKVAGASAGWCRAAAIVNGS